MSTDANQLSKLWEDLAAPSAKVFLQALRARGIQARASDVRKFIASKSERQVLQPGNRFTGKIAAFYQNDRWAADIISYVSRPVVQGGKEYKYILIVQDMFSRYLWTAPLVSVANTTDAFERIAKSVAPRALVVDRGVEFRAAKFQAVCTKYDILLEYKATQDGNGQPRDWMRRLGNSRDYQPGYRNSARGRPGWTLYTRRQRRSMHLITGVQMLRPLI